MTSERMHGLWNEVERALDARRSPFEDAGLAARLAREPAAEQAVRRLLCGLERVERAAPSARRFRHGPFVLAAVVLLFSFAAKTRSEAHAEPRLAHAVHLSVRSERPAPRLARITLEPTRVLAWTLEGEQP